MFRLKRLLKKNVKLALLLFFHCKGVRYKRVFVFFKFICLETIYKDTAKDSVTGLLTPLWMKYSKPKNGFNFPESFWTFDTNVSTKSKPNSKTLKHVITRPRRITFMKKRLENFVVGRFLNMRRCYFNDVYFYSYRLRWKLRFFCIRTRCSVTKLNGV